MLVLALPASMAWSARRPGEVGSGSGDRGGEADPARVVEAGGGRPLAADETGRAAGWRQRGGAAGTGGDDGSTL